MNEARRRKLGGYCSWQSAKHVKLHSTLHVKKILSFITRGSHPPSLPFLHPSTRPLTAPPPPPPPLTLPPYCHPTSSPSTRLRPPLIQPSYCHPSSNPLTATPHPIPLLPPPPRPPLIPGYNTTQLSCLCIEKFARFCVEKRTQFE